MDTVTAAVEEKGQPAPMFHIYSETIDPCPAQDTGTFPEFPGWPVELDQVRGCGWVYYSFLELICDMGAENVQVIATGLRRSERLTFTVVCLTFILFF